MTADRRLSVASDDGNASLEFITVGMLLLLPVVYLVLVMSAIQGSAFAVQGAARQAARVYVQADDPAEAEADAQRAVDFALSDYGLEPGSATVQVRCSPRPTACLTRLGYVTVTVRTEVDLPLSPPAIGGFQAPAVPLEATSTQQVSRFGGAG